MGFGSLGSRGALEGPSRPRSGVKSFDCWGLVDGPVNVFYSITLSWAIPAMLLLPLGCLQGAVSSVYAHVSG